MALLIDAAVIVNETSQEFYKQPIFYGIGHFSKFIPPGSKRVDVTSNQNVTDVENEEVERMEMMKKFLVGKAPIPVPFVVAPAVVVCLATANSDGSYTAVILNK